MGSGQLQSTAAATLGGLPVVLASPNCWGLCPNWATFSSVASPGFSSGTLTLLHGTTPQFSPWPFKSWDFNLNWGSTCTTCPLMVLILSCSPWLLDAFKAVPPRRLVHYHRQLPAWGIASATSGPQLVCADPNRTLNKRSEKRLTTKRRTRKEKFSAIREEKTPRGNEGFRDDPFSSSGDPSLPLLPGSCLTCQPLFQSFIALLLLLRGSRVLVFFSPFRSSIRGLTSPWTNEFYVVTAQSLALEKSSLLSSTSISSLWLGNL